MDRTFDLVLPEGFSRSRYFTPKKVTYKGTSRNVFASTTVKVQGRNGLGGTVSFEVDIETRKMVSRPKDEHVFRASRRMVRKIVTHTIRQVQGT